MVMDDHLNTPPRPDGGTSALHTPPKDLLNEETLKPELLAENAPGLQTLVNLLNQPALARVYVYVCYWGPVSPPEVVDDLELSKSTAYDYIDRLAELDLITRDDSTRPQQLTADPVILVDPHTPVIITPTVLHA
jgi:hypothetical protein